MIVHLPDRDLRLLCDYLFAGLSEEESLEVRQRLATDVEFAERHKILQGIVQAIRNEQRVNLEVPFELRERTLRAIGEPRVGRMIVQPEGRRSLYGLTLAAVVLIAGTLAIVLARRENPTSSSLEKNDTEQLAYAECHNNPDK